MRNSRSRGRRTHRHTDFSVQTPLLGEEELCRMLESRKNPLVLVLDGLQDPHNLGACLRTADACGVDAVVVPKDRAAPMTETVRRVACGGAEHTPLSRVTNLARCLRRLRDCGLRVVGTSDAAATPLWEADLTGPLALAMGAEGQGLRRLTTEICDSLVHIPMTPGAGVECLNVSVAAGVCLFEAKRQRCMR